MKITVLTENTSHLGLPCEHGLSLYIEANGVKLLFDSGQSGLFAENAARLGVDLSAVEIAVLSHGHYDHGGGLMRFLQLNQKAKIYMSRHAFDPYYNGERYIGLDASLRDSGRIVPTDGMTSLGSGLTLCDLNDIETEPAPGAAGLNRMENGVMIPDDFRHEQYLLIEESGKRVLFSACSHKGVLAIAERFRPDVLIGGFHFMKLPLDEKLLGYAERLNACDTEYYTCHCTGVEQYDFIKPHMPRLHYISTGDMLTIGSHM